MPVHEGETSENMPFRQPVGAPWVIWTGASTTNAPTNVPSGTVGFNNDGASTANVYIYDAANTTWRDTTQTVAGFFGV